LGERADFADQRRRIKGRNGDWAARAVGDDCHGALENQHCAISRLALEHEDGAGFE
jgi:hypothetical protein